MANAINLEIMLSIFLNTKSNTELAERELYTANGCSNKQKEFNFCFSV